ncbi:serine/threonine-protein kinase PLK4-like [Eriocheir sinensis]|uniref:serine/threonine-protein kinase PLK4-like n=1 Tax=Eriocheir sinensis TaxID=95602 RepID=UPI0021C64EBD|nr:serine/threonine-protein kinase PLK4-like [Eriocheir sinensis]
MNQRNAIGSSIEDFDVGEQLGKGGFATVYHARCRNTGRDVAVKKINKSQITAGGLINRVRQEVTIHSRLSHPSILQLYTFFEDHHHVYLILELCVKGELQKHLKNLGRVLTESEAREYLRQIIDGMLYLHSKAIIHRDLTLSNILLDTQHHVKIADFGLATQLLRPDDRHTTMCGTPNYISPEVVTRSSHGLESDVWSLGCMLFIMLVGHPPFDTKGLKESIFTKVVMGDYKVPSYVSAEARSLIADCLQKNPKERIKLELVPSHPFMTGGGKTDASRMCDSGMYTMTTVATTHHTRAPLTAISETEWSEGPGQPSGHHPPGSTHSELRPRHPPSPPVRMKSSPRDLLPPNAGIIDSLKRKFTPLPSLRRGEDFAFPPPSIPPPARRERDVYEERHRQHQHQHTSEPKHCSSSSCEDKSASHHSSSSTSSTARAKTSDHRGPRQSCGRSPKKSRSLERDAHSRDTSNMPGGYYSDASQAQYQSNHGPSESYGRLTTQQSHTSESSHDSVYSQKYNVDAASGSRDLLGAADGYQREDPQHAYNTRCRERPVSASRSHDYSQDRLKDTGRERHGHSHRSRSLERFKERPRDPTNIRVRDPKHPSARDRSNEAYRDRTHPCSQSSHHRSCECEEWHSSTISCSNRPTHTRTDNRGWRGDQDSHSGYTRVSSSSQGKGAKPPSKGEDSAQSASGMYSNMLSDIPSVPHNTPARSDASALGSTQQPSNPKHPVTPKKSSSGSQTLREQASPLSSRRLKKVRFRSNKYFLNILDNGEVCLEHLSVRHNQELVDDICRISPDGLRIVIYRPNGGSGSAPGESPLPLPEEGADLIYSFENLPAKYWAKYKAAARFVKLLRSRTTKITYYSEQAKFYLMENSPDPDFVGQFYHGTKITHSSNGVVVRETSGVSHSISHSAASKALPLHLQPLLSHFKEVHSHCRHLEQVLDDLANKTELSCFPVIMGSRPPSATISPPESTRSRGHASDDKENRSPTSLQSFRSPQNIMAQLGSFEGSLASVHASGVPPLIRAPLAPHLPSNIPAQSAEPPKTSPVRVYIQNIGWASKGSDGEVLVEYLDGSRVQVSSNSPRVMFTEASGASSTYSVKDNLPLALKEKLAQMQTVLSCLAQSTNPKVLHMDHR